MKKIIVTIAILTFLTVFAGTVFAITGTVNTQNLNLRDKPSTSDSNVIAQLSNGATVNILEELDGWYKVSYGNNEGYVSKQYLTVNSNSNTVTVQTNPSNDQETESEDGQGKVLSDAVVYSLPLINATKVSNLSANNKVTVISEVGKWKYILTDEVSGWVLGNKIEGTVKKNQGNNETENNSSGENNQVNSQGGEGNNNEVVDNNQENNNNAENNVVENTTLEGNSQTSEYPKTMYVNVDGLNVREQASTSSDIIASVEKNDEIRVTGESDDWYSIELNGTKGFVKKDYLSSNKS